ncbi:MAG: hypothetical protein ISP45_15550 [Reyranella sp.]|nr:hypothetical protein [Reyranella sp.]
MNLLLRVIAILGPISGTLLLWAAQVGPEDAVSNLAKWAKLVGLDAPPKWLLSETVASWATVLGGSAFAAGICAIVFLWWRARVLRRPKCGKAPASSIPSGGPATVGRAASDIQIEFANECNEEHISSQFKRSRELFASGREMDLGQVSLNEFFIGVRNLSVSRTLRNVRIVVHWIGGTGPTSLVDLSLIADRTKKDVVDIPPGLTDYFLLGQNMANSNEGMFHPLIVPYHVYQEHAAERDRRKHEGLRIIYFGGKTSPILKNDGYKIQLGVYADDAAPVEATFTVNARGKTVVLLDQSSVP